MFPAGTRIRRGSDLVLWVHATFLESAILVYEQLVAPVSEADRDACCDEAAGVALALGARARVPRTACAGRHARAMPLAASSSATTRAYWPTR
jgi:uncharacterized protein (DUF2236 family)